MVNVGVICEYNPFHLGHQKQFQMIRDHFGADCRIICLMSGDYVQRGAPAITEKLRRAKAAVLCGADLVLELPLTGSLSSAEGFASTGVRILSPICDYLCFGTESMNSEMLIQISEALLSPVFSSFLKTALQSGCSFPAARQAALREMGLSLPPLNQPNDILALEYSKAILVQSSRMKPMPILRDGNYHSEVPDPANPSATSLRRLMLNGQDWSTFIPQEAHKTFQNAPLYALQAGERAILARLRTMSDSDFEALPYGSEGLWRKLMHASRSCADLEDILTTVKSKRYTRSRLDRMVMCAFLGLRQEDMTLPVPYTRILSFNARGRTVIKEAKANTVLLNIGESTEHAWWQIEKRCSDLYGLFRIDDVPAPDADKQRVVYLSSGEAADE